MRKTSALADFSSAEASGEDTTGVSPWSFIIGFSVFKEKRVSQLPKEQREEEISLEEKELIEAWIIEQGLNQYADPKDTVYMGGTPLFDEMTGESIDKYEYILRDYPQRPWRK